MSAAHVGSESLWKQAFKDAVLALDPSSSSTEARSRTGRPRGSAAGSTHRRTIQSPGTNGARRRQAHHSVPVAGTLKSVSKWGRWLERFTASAGRLATLHGKLAEFPARARWNAGGSNKRSSPTHGGLEIIEDLEWAGCLLP